MSKAVPYRVISRSQLPLFCYQCGETVTYTEVRETEWTCDHCKQLYATVKKSYDGHGAHFHTKNRDK
jgi:ribosomal protein L37AE/L43A